MAEHLPLQIDNLAPMLLRQPGGGEEFAVILVRHETNFHALLLVRGFQAAFAGDLARVLFGFFAERKKARANWFWRREKRK